MSNQFDAPRVRITAAIIEEAPDRAQWASSKTGPAERSAHEGELESKERLRSARPGGDSHKLDYVIGSVDNSV